MDTDAKTGPTGPRPELLNGKSLPVFLLERIKAAPADKRDRKLFWGHVMPSSVEDRLRQHEQQLGLPSINNQTLDYISQEIVELFGPDWGTSVTVHTDAPTGWSIYRFIDEKDQLHAVGTVKPKVTIGSQSNLQRVLLNHRTLTRLLPVLRDEYPALAADLIAHANERLGKKREGLVDGYGKDWLPLLALYEVFNGIEDQQEALALLDEWARYYAVTSFKTKDAANFIAMAALTAATTNDSDTWLTVKILNPETSDVPEEAKARRKTVAGLTEAVRDEGMAPLYSRNARVMARFTILNHLQGASTFEEIKRRLGECVLMTMLGIAPHDSAFDYVREIPADDIHELVDLSSYLLYADTIGD